MDAAASSPGLGRRAGFAASLGTEQPRPAIVSESARHRFTGLVTRVVPTR
jgi:hypothetical protein